VPDEGTVPEPAASFHTKYELTVLAKEGDGALTKHIYLDEQGKLVSDGSACLMARGKARRVRVTGLAALGNLIKQLQQNEALALGALYAKLPDRVDITTKAQLQKQGDGDAPPDLVARTAAHIGYSAGQPALVLIDFDSKGMPREIVEQLDNLGGVWNALCSMVAVDLADAGRVIRPSTSSGLYRTDTGEQLPGSQNAHIYLLVKDGADIERFLRSLHDRCWLAGLGWYVVSSSGQLLERSIIDRMVGAPERLVFEGPPVITPPIAQDAAARTPVVIEGDVLDTVAACRPLSLVEQTQVKLLQSNERARLGAEARKLREAYIAERAKDLAERIGQPIESAKRIIEKQSQGTLLPDLVLPFDDPELAGKTVGDVLADPDRYEGETLADPLEGVAYGTCKARIMRRTDGTLWIHSFAHGRTVYELKLDKAAAYKLLEAAPVATLVNMYLRIMTTTELDVVETTELRQLVSKRTKVGVRALGQMESAAKRIAAARRREEMRQQRLAARTDPRPQITAPRHDAEWLPVMNTLNEVLGGSKEPEPPMRDVDGVMTAVRPRRIPDMHLLTADGANAVEARENRLPPPEQPLLSRLSVPQVGELIERYIQHVHPEDHVPVHLHNSFVAHYVNRPYDDALPVVATVATLPMVLPGGLILCAPGLDRERGIVFRVSKEIIALLPKPEHCTPTRMRNAMSFLTDDWLCDVSTDATGKGIIIVAALALIERSLLPDRPVYFVTAGRRGGGKTTLLIMLLMAITGLRPAASAWSTNEEERRKALVTFLLEGVAAIIWDNIARGTQISCPHIERACTTAFYSDRRLGVNELIATSAAANQFFTGNNIGAKGDLASRELEIRIDVSRTDPENRTFKHPDPIGWTEANRGKILRALYTILLGNPMLRGGSNSPANTRFKAWWRLCGSAVEHAAALAGHSIDFRRLFLAQEEGEEESASLADALGALAGKWSGETKFAAKDVATLIKDRNAGWATDADQERGQILQEFLFPALAQNQVVSAKAVGKRLVRHLDDPVLVGNRTLKLTRWKDTSVSGDAASSFAVKPAGELQP
jgi:hypothetical protein